MNALGENVAVQFTEEMRGFVTFGNTNYEEGYRRGEEDGSDLMLHLTIRADDVHGFLASQQHEAVATGYVEGTQLGGKRPIEKGVFNLFVDTKDLNSKVMLYRMFFYDEHDQQLTLSGFKRIQNHPGPDIWRDTTTLYTNIFHGHISQEKEASGDLVAAGILRISLPDFMKQLTTIRAYGPTFTDRTKGVKAFGSHFFGRLWEVYGLGCLPQMDRYEREIPLYTTEGVTDARVTIHPFSTADKLGLSLLRFWRTDCDDVVVILHGLTTSSDMFIMPEHYNLVQYLLDNGYGDVWTLDYRMSSRYSYNLRRNQYNMDDIALFDYPPALATMREHIGSKRRIHVICHCLGSVSFMMSLFGKAVDGIRSVIANSVALTPRIPLWSSLKLSVGPFLLDTLGIEYINPYWRRQPGFSVGKLLAWGVSALHRECKVPECHMLSFMWGSGSPALYLHENLHDVTHKRGGDLYSGVSLNYYRHVRKMVASDNTAVVYEPTNPKYSALPRNYFEHARDIQTPVLFITGEQNNVFTDSNIVCHQKLEKIVPGRHERHIFPNYGHQDVFMGKNCHNDIFPRLLEFLRTHSRP